MINKDKNENNKDDKVYFFDKPKNVKRLMTVFYSLCVILVLADFVIHRHVILVWEKIPAFYALYGFVACVALVVVAKLIRKVVMRKEDYYND